MHPWKDSKIVGYHRLGLPYGSDGDRVCASALCAEILTGTMRETQTMATPTSEAIAPERTQDIKVLAPEQLQALMREWGEPSYRVQQIVHWIHKLQARAWEEMTNLPKALRRRLEETVPHQTLQLVQVFEAEEGTRKFLWQLPDGEWIESVLIPASRGEDGRQDSRRTLCVSTQVGCAFGCRFCASGLHGFRRDLEGWEIVDQVLAAERWLREQQPLPRGERHIHNLVIMGMGEPLANYDRLIQALTVLNAPWGFQIGARRITISTCGLPQQIVQLADRPEQFRLAVSLHATTNEVRDQLMPVNRRYPLEELLAACRYYAVKRRKMITLEYLLIRGLNDSVGQIRELARIARSLHAKVNLIPYNPVPGLPWQRPTSEHQQRLLEELTRRGVTATLRREKGTSIEAACGQLRLRRLQEQQQDSCTNEGQTSVETALHSHSSDL